jgi:cellulose 1,4-beta-cellobiosidase
MKYLRPIADCCLLVGSRVFMMEDDSHYRIFKLLNQEISFEVDTSSLVCGVNGALYFVGMDADGGSGRYPSNKAGAKYGTGYCDAQCPRYVRFIDGEVSLFNFSVD